MVFLGEAGCGKSEIAVNLALHLAAREDKPVHFYDLDMTQPLFRSRDAAELLEASGVQVHFEQQFMDAPTLPGGVRKLLLDTSCYTILDVGGDYIGARAIGGYAGILNREETAVCYVVNPYRPWSMDMTHIDGVLSQILNVSHVQLRKLLFIGNPNLGLHTTAEDVRVGVCRIQETLGQTVPVSLLCAKRELCGALPEIPLLPLTLWLSYEWEEQCDEPTMAQAI